VAPKTGKGNMNTTVKLKEKYWPEFIAACESQWRGGGERYALSEDKEFTDLVCEVAGNVWIGGTMAKYIGELINSNPKPEVNFFKLATYAFLWWLKEQENLDKSKIDKGEGYSFVKASDEAKIRTSFWGPPPFVCPLCGNPFYADITELEELKEISCPTCERQISIKRINP
jgi:DNA-directed RNA polymerase subunit RPC12/RpoP